MYSYTGLSPLCYELCADNGHLSPVWVYQAGPVALGVPPHIQKRTGGAIAVLRGGHTSPLPAYIVITHMGGEWGFLC